MRSNATMRQLRPTFRQLASAEGLDGVEAGMVEVAEGAVSATRIRASLMDGDVDLAGNSSAALRDRRRDPASRPGIRLGSRPSKTADMSTTERDTHEHAVLRLTAPYAPLPDFSGFHPRFRDGQEATTPEGDAREAFYLSYDDACCEYLLADDAQQRVEEGEQVVSATFVTPYPPGFPVLVPGQLFSQQILSFMRSLDTPEVHGYRPDLGYRVYVDRALVAPPPHPRKHNRLWRRSDRWVV